jgi:hypothetical protein
MALDGVQRGPEGLTGRVQPNDGQAAFALATEQAAALAVDYAAFADPGLRLPTRNRRDRAAGPARRLTRRRLCRLRRELHYVR